MSEFKGHCPYRHSDPIPLGNGKGTRYENLQDIAAVLKTSVPTVMSDTARILVQEIDTDNLPEKLVFSKIWQSYLVDTLKNHLNLEGINTGSLHSISTFLREDYNDKRNPHLISMIDSGWLSIIAEAGIFSTMGIRISKTLESILDHDPKDIVSIRKTLGKGINKGFSVEDKDLRVFCKGKGIAIPIILTTTLNLFAKKNGFDFYIEPLKEDGTKKKFKEIIEEYQKLVKTAPASNL